MTGSPHIIRRGGSGGRTAPRARSEEKVGPEDARIVGTEGLDARREDRRELGFARAMGGRLPRPDDLRPMTVPSDALSTCVVRAVLTVPTIGRA